MWLKGTKLRSGWVILWVLAASLLLAVGIVAFTKLDWEKRQSDPARVAKLAQTDLSASEPTLARPGDWPQWRGPNRDGLSLETGLLPSWPSDGPRVHWKKSIGRGFSSVAVSAGRLFTMEQEKATDSSNSQPPYEAVVCWETVTGKEIWRFRYPNRYDERFGSGRARLRPWMARSSTP